MIVIVVVVTESARLCAPCFPLTGGLNPGIRGFKRPATCDPGSAYSNKKKAIIYARACGAAGKEVRVSLG